MHQAYKRFAFRVIKQRSVRHSSATILWLRNSSTVGHPETEVDRAISSAAKPPLHERRNGAEVMPGTTEVWICEIIQKSSVKEVYAIGKRARGSENAVGRISRRQST
jgi:hypothetical protein